MNYFILYKSEVLYTPIDTHPPLSHWDKLLGGWMKVLPSGGTCRWKVVCHLVCHLQIRSRQTTR